MYKRCIQKNFLFYNIIHQNPLNIALFFEKLAHCMSEEGRKVQGLTRKLKVITTIGQEP